MSLGARAFALAATVATTLYAAALLVAVWPRVSSDALHVPFGIALGLLLLQFAAILLLAQGEARWAQRSVEINLALLVGLSALVWVSRPNQGLVEQLLNGAFGLWFAAHWGTFSVFPLLALAQWAGAARMRQSAPELLWRGAVVGALFLCGALGMIAHAALIDLAPSRFTLAFFLLGTLIHLAIAGGLLLKRPDASWFAMAAGVLFLISGWWLSLGGRAMLTQDPETAGPLAHTVPRGLEVVADVLRLGWFEVAPYLPPLCYAVTALGGYVLWRRPQVASE